MATMVLFGILSSLSLIGLALGYDFTVKLGTVSFGYPAYPPGFSKSYPYLKVVYLCPGPGKKGKRVDIKVVMEVFIGGGDS